MSEASRFVVSSEWLESELGSPDLRIVDASFYLPAQKRNADADYTAGHIPGAVRFDHDKVADHSTDLPHMVPAPEVFAKAVGDRSEEHTSELQSLMRISYAVFCLKKKKTTLIITTMNII